MSEQTKVPDSQQVEELKKENETLRQQCAEKDARIEQLQVDVLRAADWLMENGRLKVQITELVTALEFIKNIQGNPPMQVARKTATNALSHLTTQKGSKE